MLLLQADVVDGAGAAALPVRTVPAQLRRGVALV
jgi:hypothetical protein